MSGSDADPVDDRRPSDESEADVIDLSEEVDVDGIDLELSGEPDADVIDLSEEPEAGVVDRSGAAEPEGIDPAPTPTQPRPGPPAVSDDVERARAIEAVLRDEARRDVLRAAAYRRPRSSLGMQVAAVLLCLAAAGGWMLPLPLLRPEVALRATPQRQEAGLRLAMYVQAQQIKTFWQTRGRLPDVLRETGEPLPGLRYERLDARTYRLSGASGTAAVDWISSDSLGMLLLDAHLQVDMGLAP